MYPDFLLFSYPFAPTLVCRVLWKNLCLIVSQAASFDFRKPVIFLSTLRAWLL